MNHTWILVCRLTLILLTWNIGWVPNNASKWQMGFNSAFKGLTSSSSSGSIVGTLGQQTSQPGWKDLGYLKPVSCDGCMETQVEHFFNGQEAVTLQKAYVPVIFFLVLLCRFVFCRFGRPFFIHFLCERHATWKTFLSYRIDSCQICGLDSGGNVDHDFIQCDTVYVRKNVLLNFSDPVSNCTSSYSKGQIFQLQVGWKATSSQGTYS